MKITQGSMVVVRDTYYSNGSNEHAAVVTRVWAGDDTRNVPVLVNVTAFPDGAAPYSVTSVAIYDTKAQVDGMRGGWPP